MSHEKIPSFISQPVPICLKLWVVFTWIDQTYCIGIHVFQLSRKLKTVAICQILFSLLRLLHSVVTFCLVKYSQSENE